MKELSKTPRLIVRKKLIIRDDKLRAETKPACFNASLINDLPCGADPFIAWRKLFGKYS